CGQGTELPRTF
nr:immunoglobulin light chain junction region [Macaca mulatta]MOW35941.1 immunoglobulin light chain junction region [Macaca mulatta]